MRKVELLVSRTNVGEIGDVVEYDDVLAANHVERGLVKYADRVDDDAGSDGKAAGNGSKAKKTRKGQRAAAKADDEKKGDNEPRVENEADELLYDDEGEPGS